MIAVEFSRVSRKPESLCLVLPNTFIHPWFWNPFMLLCGREIPSSVRDVRPYVGKSCSSRCGQACNCDPILGGPSAGGTEMFISLWISTETRQPSFQIYSTVAMRVFWTWLPACSLALGDSKDYCGVSDHIATLLDTTVPSGKWFEQNPKSFRFPGSLRAALECPTATLFR